MLIMYHIRWFTIPDQANLPAEQQRFVELVPNESWGMWFWQMIVMPCFCYFIWSVTYSFINFKLAKERIQKKNRPTLFKYIVTLPFVAAYLKKNDITVTPLYFMIFHFVFFFVNSAVAMLMYHFFWVNFAFVLFYTMDSFWNGACFYMEYFAKKYEKQLEELEKMHKDTEEQSRD